MGQALIYISYGIPKSGSTLAFELVRAILELNGCPQGRLSKEALPAEQAGNFVARLTGGQLEAIEREVAGRGSPVALKTHSRPTPAAKDWLASGRAIGHCVYRDPREIVLSAMDHGAKSRAEGQRAFAQVLTFEDGLAVLRKQLPLFLEWARLPGMIPLFYDELAFDTLSVVRSLCRQIGMTADPEAVERRAKEAFTQFNKGVPGRYREMSEAESERVLSEFEDFYAEFIPSRERSAASASSGFSLFRGWFRRG